MYPVCTNETYLRTGFPSLSIFLEIDNPKWDLYSILRSEELGEINEFCKNNFSYDPISPELYIYSAQWLEEIYSLERWINLTKKMCNAYQEVCEGYGDKYNYDYNFLTLSAAFEIVNFEDKYNCFLETNSEDNLFLDNNRYTRFTSSKEFELYDEDGERINRAIANQYIRSSVIFPKPVNGYEGLKFSPENQWAWMKSTTQEPPYLWWCIPGSNNSFEGPWLIKGYGPPFIRGRINTGNPVIKADGNWVMWSVIEPGPNSTVVELEITKFYWFNEIRTTVQFCEDYEISDEYLKAKKDAGLNFRFTGLVNFEFVTANYCESRLDYHYEYP